MRTAFRLVQLVVFIVIILVIGRGLSLSKYAQLFYDYGCAMGSNLGSNYHMDYRMDRET